MVCDWAIVPLEGLVYFLLPPLPIGFVTVHCELESNHATTVFGALGRVVPVDAPYWRAVNIGAEGLPELTEYERVILYWW